jgi:hypothetical protein
MTAENVTVVVAVSPRRHAVEQACHDNASVSMPRVSEAGPVRVPHNRIVPCAHGSCHHLGIDVVENLSIARRA